VLSKNLNCEFCKPIIKIYSINTYDKCCMYANAADTGTAAFKLACLSYLHIKLLINAHEFYCSFFVTFAAAAEQNM